jgi:hypothetical protein
MSTPLVTGLHALSLLALFGAGNIVVFLVTWFVRRVLRHEPNLAARRDGVFEINQKPMRIEAAQSELAGSKVERTDVQQRAEKRRESITLRVPLDDPPSTKFAYGLLGAILGEGEALVFLLLSAPAMLFGLPPEIWAIAAPPIAAVGILMLHVIAGHFITDKHRPARTIRRAKVAAGISGAAVVLAIWAVLSGRNLTDAHLVEQIVGAGLMTLAALLSITAAMCTMVASTLWEAEQEEHELARLENLEHEYDRHIDLLERDIARLTDTPDGPPEHPSGGSKGGSRTTPLESTPAPTDVDAGFAEADFGHGVRRNGTGNMRGGVGSLVPMLLLMLGLGISNYARAQAPLHTNANQVAVATVRTSAPAFARQNVCEELIDITSSEARNGLQVTLSELGAQWPLIVDAMQCTTIRLTPFAGDLFAFIREFPLPQDGAFTTCGVTSASNSASARSRAIAVIYPAVAASHQQDSIATCTAVREQAHRRIVDQRRTVFEQVGDTVRAIGNLPQRGPCTALWQAVDRALIRSQVVLVISDAVPTCTPPPMIQRIPLDGQLIFLLIPPTDSGGLDRANALVERLATLERQYPGARALIAPEATAEFWRRLRTSKP